MATARIVGYSERGLIHAMVRMFQARPSLVENVLNAIVWVNGEKRRFSFPEDVEVDMLVEPGFAQFGNPDLLLAVKQSGEDPLLFFIEAKVAEYGKSAKPNREGIRGSKGFNSSINGQLSLRYRLAQALTVHKEGSLEEPNWIWKAADCPDAVNDPHPTPRRLARKENVQVIPKLLKPEGTRIRLENCYFIALTMDQCLPPGMTAEDTKPHYMDDSGRNQIAEVRTGWLGWSALSEILRGRVSAGDWIDWTRCHYLLRSEVAGSDLGVGKELSEG